MLPLPGAGQRQVRPHSLRCRRNQCPLPLLPSNPPWLCLSAKPVVSVDPGAVTGTGHEKDDPCQGGATCEAPGIQGEPPLWETLGVVPTRTRVTPGPPGSIPTRSAGHDFPLNFLFTQVLQTHTTVCRVLLGAPCFLLHHDHPDPPPHRSVSPLGLQLGRPSRNLPPLCTRYLQLQVGSVLLRPPTPPKLPTSWGQIPLSWIICPPRVGGWPTPGRKEGLEKRQHPRCPLALTAHAVSPWLCLRRGRPGSSVM